MFKIRNVILFVLLGLVTTSFLYLLTTPHDPLLKTSKYSASCSEGFEFANGNNLIVKGGAPLRSQKSYNQAHLCGTAEYKISFWQTSQMLISWQFVVDWMIWTLAWVGAIFVFKKVYANIGH